MVVGVGVEGVFGVVDVFVVWFEDVVGVWFVDWVEGVVGFEDAVGSVFVGVGLVD